MYVVKDKKTGKYLRKGKPYYFSKWQFVEKIEDATLYSTKGGVKNSIGIRKTIKNERGFYDWLPTVLPDWVEIVELDFSLVKEKKE